MREVAWGIRLAAVSLAAGVSTLSAASPAVAQTVREMQGAAVSLPQAREACTPQAPYTHCAKYTHSVGVQTFDVPADVTTLHFQLAGGGGGGDDSTAGNQ